VRDLGESSGDIPTRMMGYGGCSFTFNCLGEFAAARAHSENALALFDPADRPFYAELMSNDMLVFLLDFSAKSLACLGHLDQARSCAEAALAEARRLSHPHTLVDALGWALSTGWFTGSEPASLLRYADQLLAVSVEHEFALYRAMGTLWRGWFLAASGDADDGIPLLTAGLAGMQDAGFIVHTSFWLARLADAYRIAGQWQAALGHLAKARRFADETGERWALAEVLRLRGDVLLAMGDPAAAEAGYREAIAVAQQQSAKLWELRAATSLARLWSDQGKRDAGRGLLAPVYGWFTEGFGTRVLQEAKALIEELAAVSPR
jgi:predicted ATPase